MLYFIRSKLVWSFYYGILPYYHNFISKNNQRIAPYFKAVKNQLIHKLISTCYMVKNTYLSFRPFLFVKRFDFNWISGARD